MKRNYLFLAAAAAVCISFTSCKKDKVEVWRDDTPTIDFNDPRVLNALLEISDKYGDYPHSDGRSYTQFKDMNGDGKVSEKEAARVQYLNISGYGIRNFDELKYFTSLEIFYSENNPIEDLDLSGNTALKQFSCMSNELTSLDVSKNTELRTIDCKYNKISVLDINGCEKLEELNCEGNSLQRLVLDRCSALQKLNCAYNGLTSLDVSDCPDLRTLECNDNSLTRLDVSKNKYLESLSCSGNPLEELIIYEFYSLPESFIQTYQDIIKYSR